jgi:circadian clock protein KaiC
MISADKNLADEFPKAPTGIEGFDQITRGGMPRGKATLVTGGPGCGKTVFGLQTLANSVFLWDEPGIFIAFEETSRQIIENAASFGWNLVESEKLFFLDAMPDPDTIAVGEFDFSGMLAVLLAKAEQMKARRIVFDSIDVLLHLLPSSVERRREMNRLHNWLVANELTAIITAKIDWQRTDAVPWEEGVLQYMPFIVDCVIVLTHQFEGGYSQRRLRILKYRGSSFTENECPFSIGASGFEIAPTDTTIVPFGPVPTERISTGVEPLDRMLGGGLIRGATTIITGEPGTAKTTLAGAFSEAACKRGERTLYIAFDESCEEIARNLRSVSIQLDSYVKTGRLVMHSGQVGSASAEEHLLQIRGLVQRYRPSCMVIDPFSAFMKIGSELATQAVAARMIRWIKSLGITLVCTSLPTGTDRGLAAATLMIATAADTWVNLSFFDGGFDGGERNRGLAIFKSRGTKHSNQVRELILDDSGISLAEPYTSAGTVLMGTMRWQKERTDIEERARLEAAFDSKRAAVHNEVAELEAQLETMQRSVEEKRLILRSMSGAKAARKEDEELWHSGMIRLRQAKEIGPMDETSPKEGAGTPPADERPQ